MIEFAATPNARERVLRKLTSGDLLDLLSLCAAEDLDPLVKVLLTRLANSLDINPDYKKHHPDHTKYVKLIADEIRLFGGNSFRNILRGGEGPSYADLVDDVCKHLKVPFKPGDVLGNEANLLDIYIQSRWNALGPEEQRRLAEEARKTATEKASGFGDVASGVAIAATTRLLLGPLGWATCGLSLFEPNLKVTIPCVIHIAYLRRKMTSEWQHMSDNLLPGPQRNVSVVDTNQLVITDDDGEPVLSLARLPAAPSGVVWSSADVGGSGISRLSPLLAAVPSIANAAEVASGQYYRVVCNGPLAVAQKGGGFRAFSVGSGGIQSHANLFTPDKLATMVNVTALMNVASLALAQKHLADIEKRLKQIETSIKEIRKFQVDERHATITGSLRYFQQIAPSVLEGERPDRVLIQLESLEVKLLQTQDHIAKDIRSALVTVEGLRSDEWFGSAEDKSAIEFHQNKVKLLFQEMILCLRARGAGWQLLSAFPGDARGKLRRRNEIQKTLDEFKPMAPLVVEADKIFREKIQHLSSFWNKSETINERKLTLLRKTEAFLVSIMEDRTAVLTDLKSVDEMLARADQPIHLLAKVKNGQITGICAE